MHMSQVWLSGIVAIFSLTLLVMIIIIVLHVQPWPPHISFIQVFDRFLTSLMAVDHFLYTNAQSTEYNIFSFLRAFYHAIHQTCQKPVKNLYETYAG